MRRNFFICGLTGWCLDRADFRLDVSHLRHGMYHQTAVQIL